MEDERTAEERAEDGHGRSRPTPARSSAVRLTSSRREAAARHYRVKRFSSRCSTDSRRLGRAISAVIPVLHTGNVRHAPLVTVPTGEPGHVERPEPTPVAAHADEPIGIPYVHAPHAVEMCRRPFLNGRGLSRITRAQPSG